MASDAEHHVIMLVRPTTCVYIIGLKADHFLFTLSIHIRYCNSILCSMFQTT